MTKPKDRLIKPRRPVAWNALLRKSHVHTESRSEQRRQMRQSLPDEAWQYFDDSNNPGVDEDHGLDNSPEENRQPGIEPDPSTDLMFKHPIRHNNLCA